MATIETERLLLRPFREEDWRAVYEWVSDAEVCRSMDGPRTAEQARELVRKQAAQEHGPQRYHFAVELMAEEFVIGDCQLSVGGHPIFHPGLGDICYCFNRRYWNRGCATETVGALLRFGFESLHLHRIVCHMAVGNAASRRVVEKNGMRKEGVLKEEALIQGVWHDEFLFAILDREWQERQADERSRQ